MDTEKKPRKTCTRELKIEAVRMTTEAGISVARAARDLELNRITPYNWRRQFRRWGAAYQRPAVRRTRRSHQGQGTNRSRFYRGHVDKYTWVDVGSSYLPSDILAAFLYAQLEERESIQAKRRSIWEYYEEHLKDWARDSGVRLPAVPEHCGQSYHMFYLLTHSLEAGQALIAHLKSRGILAVFHYLSMHLSEMGPRFGGKPGDCPATEDVSDRLLRLPFCNGLRQNSLERVVQAIRAARGR